MSYISQDYLNEIGTTLSKRTKTDKRRAYAGKIAINMAKDKNDANYKKYMKFRKLMLISKKKMQQKYKSRARAESRQKMK